MTPNGSAIVSSRNVGVAVALHRKQQQKQRQRNSSRRPNGKHENNNSNNSSKRTQHRPWWKDLAYGLSLYLFCIYLPPIYSLTRSCLVDTLLKPIVSSGDAQWTDVVLVLLLSLLLAGIRITLVKAWIDVQSPQHVQAMVRCKSIHLLSSAYPQSLTPRVSRHHAVVMMGESPSSSDLGTILTLPNLSSSGHGVAGSSDDGVGLNTLEPRFMHDDQNEQHKETEPLAHEHTSVDAEQPKLKRSDSWLESTWKTVRRSSEQALVPPSRLHAAPRYATAFFRALYCLLTTTLAWTWFGSSDFWPPSVGGTGSTLNCWNLKGSPGMEEDYDDLNGWLKLFYLLQASYHLHSGAFHVLTILWATKHSSPKQPQLPPFTSYGRSLLQHGIALLLIGGSYVFASTRRLGAIGSFALDVSSLWLHVLQMAMNAQPSMPPEYILLLHRFLVIPVFFYARFFLWPVVVWKSAWKESDHWLQQMESTLFPGIYRSMILVFTGLTAILLVLNMVLLKRLLYHPHLQRVLLQDKEGTKE